MFVQVIKGKVSDRAALKTALDRWMSDLAPEASGWLGSTSGVTDDGQFFTLARFASEDDARRNSDRPEQGAWWRDTATLFDGEATFQDGTKVMIETHGDPDQAGFVQIMQGPPARDPQRVRTIMESHPEQRAAFRPDVVGSVGVEHPDGTWTMALYFTSEAEARKGEQKEPPAELKADMDEINELSTGMPSFYDIREPWLHAPK